MSRESIRETLDRARGLNLDLEELSNRNLVRFYYHELTEASTNLNHLGYSARKALKHNGLITIHRKGEYKKIILLTSKARVILEEIRKEDK